MSSIEAAVVRDEIIRQASSAEDLLHKAQASDPELVKQLTSKPLLASKTIWGTLIALVLSYLVTRFGLGLDADLQALISGCIVMAANAANATLTRATRRTISGTAKPLSVARW